MIDLSTLYALIIGTLLVSAGLTAWEGFGRWRRRPLLIWAAGWTVLALGCSIAVARTHLPGLSGWAISNMVIVTGYLLVLNGVAALDRRLYLRTSVMLVAALGLGWMIEGSVHRFAFWQHTAGVPIMIASGLTVFELRRNRALRQLRTRPVAILLPAMHTAFYAARVFVLPLFAAHDGDAVIALASKITMYEGVLYSVAMPMTLVGLVREEAQRHLIAASRTDFLTGLTNRQGLFEAGAEVLRHDRAATLLAFDLDHFKSINDAHGHAAGDAVLRSFAGVMRDVAAPDAILARLGGEEFAALLPDTDRAAAKAIGEEIAARFAALRDHGEGVVVAATVSTGLAYAGADGDDLGALLSAADRALYVAKALGRNRLVSASPLFDGAGSEPARGVGAGAAARLVA
ncbi:GGDEF domain-containing protein [Sphingomonas sp. RHCKR47]|uniref:GGDEF domain-containing protein n=1 Tax=Sphingomonas citricola TaxID=2862498 RepID=UPI001C67D289|nr:GGDEF domain-containing protein [Sphingomonas citricola]MBW6523001.1 GGDEF domain-containing protein [Sphingomonas citricola]